MNKTSRIYVTHAEDFPAESLVDQLKGQGFKNILSPKRLNLTCQEMVGRFFKKYRPEYVFLFPEASGGIQTNILKPAELIYKNIAAQANAIHYSHAFKVKKLLLVASSCMYPSSAQPIKESSLTCGALEPTNEAYAIAKIAGAKMCEAYNKQYHTRFICVVPATIYGPGGHFDEHGHVMEGLIRKCYEAKRDNLPKIEAWGTGRPKREFIYVDDFINGCLLLMRRGTSEGIFNLGTQEEISIAGLACLIKRISGCKAKINFKADKPDGARRKLLDSRKISALGFKPKVNLKKGLALTYAWYENYASNTHA